MEQPAVATLRWLMNAEETYRRKKGQYASLRQLVESGDLPAPHTLSIGDRSFNRKGYRFEVSPTADGFNASATPMAPGVRPFVGDDTGYIRSAVD
jgi:hypothetical protein